MIQKKWKIFILTFFSYSLIHAVRTAWSSLKYALNSAPYSFEPFFLGVLDMVVLLTLAASLNLFGPLVERLGAKSYLLKGMIALAIIMVLMGFLLLGHVANGIPYSILYILVGVGSCVGWPACIFILSKYFEKGMAFSLWTGSSQFGDFIALIISDLLVQELKINPGFFLIVIALLLVGVYFLNKKQLPADKQPDVDIPQESPNAENPDALIEEGDHPLSSNAIQNQKKKQQLYSSKKNVNFITVWTLPGVPGYILSFLFVKSVNAVVVAWLIFYLSMIGMRRQARIIAVLWAISTFFGGIIGSYINPKFNKTIFIASLLASAILFIFLEQVHLYPSQTEVVILILTCGLIFGGPFTLMSSSIPLLLSEKESIKAIPGAKAAIVSAMEGYGLLFCGVSLLIVPAVGVIDLHWVAALYCTISAAILLFQHLKELHQELKLQQTRRHVSQPIIEHPKEQDFNMSAPVITNVSPRRKKRMRKPKNQEIKEMEILPSAITNTGESNLVDNNILGVQSNTNFNQKSNIIKQIDPIQINDEANSFQSGQNQN